MKAFGIRDTSEKIREQREAIASKTFTVQEKVWEEVPVPGAPHRKRRILKYLPGDRITVEEARRLGLLEAKSVHGPVEDKAIHGPTEEK